MTTLADPDPSLITAQQAFAQLTGRSPLIGWMREHHALITERINTVRPSWDDITRTLARLGVCDANGQAPKTETVRRAYHRVTGALNAKGQRRRRSKAQVAAAKAEAVRASATACQLSAPASAASTLSTQAAQTGTPPAPSVPARPGRSSFDPMEGAFEPKPPSRFKPASLK